MNKACKYTGSDTRLRAHRAASPSFLNGAQDLDIPMALNGPETSVDFRTKSPGLDVINDTSQTYEYPRNGLMAMQNLDRIQSKYIFKRAQNNLNYTQISDQSSVHSFGDPPFPNFEKHLYAVPSLEIVREMVTLYFKFEAVSNSTLHRPTVEGWTEDIFGNFNGVRYDPEEGNKKAILLMITALSYAYTNNDPDDSTRLFLAAEEILKHEKGKVRLSSIQARLLQCYFLLSRARIHQCYSIFGTVVTLVHVAGFHRKNSHGDAEVASITDTEYRKRVFWCIYTLDKYLSINLGRPQKLNDEDIDQDLPSFVDGENSIPISFLNSESRFRIMIQGVNLHPKLSKVVGKIIKDLYGIQPVSLEALLEMADKHKEDLEGFRRDISHFINSGSSFGSHLSAGLRAQGIGLQIALAHAQILLHRPFLLADFSSSPFSLQKRVEDNIEGCLRAATAVADMTGILCENKMVFRALWFAHFCGYSAAVVLYVYVIRAQEKPTENWSQYLKVAETLKAQISSLTEKESLANKCSQVLAELHYEVVGQVQGNKSRDSNAHMDWGPVGTGVSRAPGPNGLFGVPVFDHESVIDRIDRWGFSSLTEW